MLGKGIKITADNRTMLMEMFDIDEEDKTDMLPIGYWVVTGFGDREPGLKDYDLLTDGNFNELYTRGSAIQNGWYEIDGP